MGWNDVEKTSGSTGDKQEYTKFPEGNTIIRILDTEPFSFWQHWLQKQQRGITCLGGQKTCPICRVIAAQKASKETPTYNSTQRHAIRIFNKTTNRMEIMVQGKGFMSNLLTLFTEVGDLKSFDIKVVRKGSDTNTTYMFFPQSPSPLTPDELEKITEIDITAGFKAPTEEQMIQLMEGKTFDEVFGQKDE